jgi:hypothetical protein
MSNPDNPAAAMSRLRWAKTTKEERSAVGKALVEARIAKLGQKRRVGPPRKRKEKPDAEKT